MTLKEDLEPIAGVPQRYRYNVGTVCLVTSLYVSNFTIVPNINEGCASRSKLLIVLRNNPLRSLRMAQLSHEQAAEELHEACKTNDLARIQELFRTKPLSDADATNELKRGLGSGSEATPTPRIRCLLEHGADLNVLGIRDIKSLDVFKLLAEFGFDIKTEAHLILQ